MFNFFCKKRRLAVFSLSSIYAPQLRTWRELTGGQVLRGTYVEPNFDKSFCGAEFWEDYLWSRIVRTASVEPKLEKSFIVAEFWEELLWSRILRIASY